MPHETWSSADLHIHSTASDGTATPGEILDWVCAETDLRVIAITDHNTNVGGLEAAAIATERDCPVEVIVGQEVESADGHIVGLWTPELVATGMSASETVGAIHAQGGIAVAAHPFAPLFWAKAGLARGSSRVYGATDYDAFEIANSTPLLFLSNWRARHYWWRNSHRMACTGGSDAHLPQIIGTSRTLFPGETAADLRRAIENRETKAARPGISPRRNWRYARGIPEIMRRDRDRRTREMEERVRPQDDLPRWLRQR